MSGPQVVSLVPSATETLLALGCPPVACTRFCEQPAIPAVGGTKDPDVAAIVALAPDKVVMNDEENRREDFVALRDAGLEIVEVSPRSLSEVGDAVCRLADAAGCRVPHPFDEWPAWVGARPAPGRVRRAVTFVWRRPWMTLGRDTYGASVLGAIGVDAAIGDDAGESRYPVVTAAQVRALAPDLLLLPSEPYPFGDRHRAEVADLVPGAAVVLVDGQDLFWWGSRTPDAVTRLAARLR